MKERKEQKQGIYFRTNDGRKEGSKGEKWAGGTTDASG
jgi:hypothetical protein